MRLSAVFVVAVVVVVGVGCAAVSEDGGPEGDVGVVCPDDLPEPSDPCLPGCGNALGVGQTCTRGGFQCPIISIGNEASFCTVDFNDTNLAFCTKPCVDDGDCGDGAVCTGDPEDPDSDKGCTPSTCI